AELTWKYRGQVLREHDHVQGEVHLRSVRREPHRVLLHADGGLYRDGLRIYQVEGISIELTEGRRPGPRTPRPSAPTGPSPTPLATATPAARTSGSRRAANPSPGRRSWPWRRRCRPRSSDRRDSRVITECATPTWPARWPAGSPPPD